MNRNWLVVAILVLTMAALFGCGHYVVESANCLKEEIQAAYACALDGRFDDAEKNYKKVVALSEEKSAILGFLIRRNLVDKANETISTLQYYAKPDNLQDLGVETARACKQLDQLGKSFFGRF